MSISQKREMLADKLMVVTAKIQEAETILAECIDAVKVITDGEAGSNVQSGQLEEACRLYFFAREGYEALDEARKRIYFQLENMAREIIPDIMTERGVRNLTLEDIQRQFVKSNTVSASMVDKEAALDWLRANGKGDLIQASVHPSTLKSFAQAYIEEQQKELPDCFKISTMTTTQVRKSVKGEK